MCATNACALPKISLHTIACSGVACPARFRAPTASFQNPAPCPLSPSPLARVPQKVRMMMQTVLNSQLLRQPQLIDHSDDDEGCAFQCHHCHRRCVNRTQPSGGGAVSSRPSRIGRTTLHCPHVRRSVRQGSRGKHTIVRHADVVPIPPVAIWLARSDVQTPGLRPIVDRYLRVSCDRYLRVSVLGRGRDFAIARSFRGVLGVLSVVFH